MQESWPNFSKKLISQVGNVIKSGKINYTTGPISKNLKMNFQNIVINFRLLFVMERQH